MRSRLEGDQVKSQDEDKEEDEYEELKVRVFFRHYIHETQCEVMT